MNPNSYSKSRYIAAVLARCRFNMIIFDTNTTFKKNYIFIITGNYQLTTFQADKNVKILLKTMTMKILLLDLSFYHRSIYDHLELRSGDMEMLRALVSKFGKPEVFYKLTTNPILDSLIACHNYKGAPGICTCVSRMKQKQLRKGL